MSSGSEELRVLSVQYAGLHFLLNRAECVASLFASDPIALKSRHPYLRELIRVGEGRLLFFDLHRFLCDAFRVESETGAQLAVIAAVSGFEAPTRALLERGVFPRLGHLGIETDRIAFRIPSNTTIRSIRMDELAPHRGSIERPLIARGILALHPTQESMGFFIDLDRLIGSRSLFAARAGIGEGA